MTRINDGGPAFPQTAAGFDGGALTGGMTLRDWYIGKALQGFCANPDFSDTFFDKVAASAIKQADSVMAAREAKS